MVTNLMLFLLLVVMSVGNRLGRVVIMEGNDGASSRAAIAIGRDEKDVSAPRIALGRNGGWWQRNSLQRGTDTPGMELGGVIIHICPKRR